jgi:hypothetical protein
MFGVAWLSIYLTYAVALMYLAITDGLPAYAYWFNIGISILNVLWLWFFSWDSRLALYLCLFVIVGLFATLYTFWMMLYQPMNDNFFYYLIRNAVSMYMGWVLIATMLNFGIVLVHILTISQKFFMVLFWVTLPLLFLVVTWIGYARENTHGLTCLIGFWIAGLWGMAGSLARSLNHSIVI